MAIDILLSVFIFILIVIIIGMEKRFIWILPSINFLIDIFSGYFEKGSILAIIRAIILYSFLFYYWTKYVKIRKFFVPILIFSFYTLILILFSNNLFNSFRIYLQITISILMFPLSYYLIENINDFKLLTISTFFTLILFIITTLISTIFKIGPSIYTESQSFLTGNIFGASLNTVSLGLILIPFLLIFNKKKHYRIIIISIALFSFIALFLTMKRTSILVVVIGLLLYFVLTEKKSKVFIFILSMIALLIIMSPLYENILIERFEARRDRFYLDSVEQEARYRETFIIWDEIFSFRNPIESIFGKQLYNSPGNYANGTFGERQIHIDYNVILHGAGIVGMLLYLIMFIPIFKHLGYVSKKAKRDAYYYNLKAIFISFFILTFVMSVSGQMYGITFRSICFIYMGGILGYFRKVSLTTMDKEIVK